MPETPTPRRGLVVSLVLLAAGLTALALLGPLVTDVVRYHFDTTVLNQAIGLDAFALVLVVPLTLWAALLCHRGHRAGPLLAMGPAGFALYMLAQYVIGPEYLRYPGNGERVFPLVVATFVSAGAALVLAWQAAARPEGAGSHDRRRGVVLLVIAAALFAGAYLANGFVSAVGDFPSYVAERAATTEYDDHPTVFWVVAFLDLAVVVPLTVAVGVGLLRGRGWARRAYYGLIGWYALVPPSVAAMAITMYARDDAAASGPKALAFSLVAVALLSAAATTGASLFRERPAGAPTG